MTDDELLRACGDRGFTPGARHVEALLEAWRAAPRGQKKTIVGALSRGDSGVAKALWPVPDDVGGAERAMRLRVLGRIHRAHPIEGFEASLAGFLADASPPVVREAARVIAKLEGAEDDDAFEVALLAVCDQAALPEKKAAVDALGRVGGATSRAYLGHMADEGDDDLRRRIEEALAMLQRRAGRDASGTVVSTQRLPGPLEIVLGHRAGVGWVVAEQLGPGIEVTAEGPSRSIVTGTWCLDELLAARSVAEVGLRFALPEGADLATRIVEALGSPELVAALSAWNEGPIRFRLSLVGGRQRAVIWQVARALATAASRLVNDSRQAQWTIEVDEDRGEVLCLPRHDPRFDYRRTDVPAASHPTLAATLAWIGSPQPGEVVWDPFCGSGSELVESVRLQPDVHLWGTDVSEAAIEAARTNTLAADLDPSRLHLECGDARTVSLPAGLSPPALIVTNPPMGRRVARDGTMKPLLAEFVETAASKLAPAGRLVWVTPLPELTGEAAERAGLQVENLGSFDMGGFEVGIQRLVKPS